MVPTQHGIQEVLEKRQLLTSSLSPYTESCTLPTFASAFLFLKF